MTKKPVLSLSKKDFRVDTFRVSTGAGGQKKDKTSSGVRITHIESGIFHSCTETRSQHENKEIAFRKLCKDPAFKHWLKKKALGLLDIEEEVDSAMKEDNLKVEVRLNGKWIPDKEKTDERN